MGKRSRVPGCTHIDVTRTHIPLEQCHLCLTASPMGFLYECQQECDRTTLREVIEQHSGKPNVKKSDLRQQLECVGLSESVIITAELGHYTKAQLELLQMQKAELRQAIEDALERDQINKWTAMIPSNHDGTISSRILTEKVSTLGSSSDIYIALTIIKDSSDMRAKGLPPLPSLLPRTFLNLNSSSSARRVPSIDAGRHRFATSQICCCLTYHRYAQTHSLRF